MIYIISPHIDDAILSLGGFIINSRNNGFSLSVENIFTVSAWANPDSIGSHANEIERDNRDVISELRKTEEKLVNEALSYKSNFWDFLDYPLRPDRESKENENNLVNMIEERMRTVLTKENMCFFPLALGHHDHFITRMVGIRLHNLGYNIYFYEDMPYITFLKNGHADLYVYLTEQGFCPIMENIDIQKKIELLKLYRSQVSNQWLNNIKNFSYNLSDNNYYERFWKPTKPILKQLAIELI